MKISEIYSRVFESELQGRYVTLDHILPLLEKYQSVCEIEYVGRSELGTKIPMIKIGRGDKIVLAWSQMHGNESTTTKALIDFLSFCNQKKYLQQKISIFLSTYSLYAIPILNPDGAKAYTRENINKVDLNRDAQHKTQAESVVLADVFTKLQPGLCLNLHDQRSIYGASEGKAATISFLAPAADVVRTVTASREEAMKKIARLARMLETHISGQIGRYDDSFNANCVGDSFQMKGTPTILFEGGHAKDDYEREKTREFIFYTFLELFGITNLSEDAVAVTDYLKIPENTSNFRDVIIRNARIDKVDEVFDIAIQYEEVLHNDALTFVPIIEAVGDLENFKGHRELDALGSELLVNSQDKLVIGMEILTILRKDALNIGFFSK